jgi:hypothetical protein
MSYISKSTGYRYIHIKGHNIAEHRHIWEQHYGAIPKGCVVHHINGDKLDNRIENLDVIQSNAEHRRLHNNTEYEDIPVMQLSSSDIAFIKSHISIDRYATGS